MKKGEIYSGTVIRADFPNKGIVFVKEEGEEAGGEVQVKNVLPGQTVSFRLTKKRHGRYEGNFMELLEPAPEEQPSACPHFGICGGCIYQTLPYEAELELKKEQILRLLRPVLPEADDLFEGIRPSPVRRGYRNKMEYTFGDACLDGPLTLGMHRRGSFYDIVSVGSCEIAGPDFGRILQETEAYFAEREIPYYHRSRHQGYLRHLLVRQAAHTGQILVDLITTTEFPQKAGKEASEALDGRSAEAELLRDWADILLSLPLEGTIAGILHTRNDSVADAVKDQGTEVLWVTDHFTEILLGMNFQITPFSFFQTNSRGAEVLYSLARDYISGAIAPDKVVYDLYSGTGTIAQILAPAARQVVGVEIVEEAVEAAKKNAAANGLDNCSFLAGDVLKVLDEIGEKPDVIVLDPPRDGVHPKALQKILNYGVESLVYISCKPTSLARDLPAFLERGYRVKRLACVDMFPGTANTETVVCLGKKKSKDYVEIGVDAEDYYRIKELE